MHGMVHNTEEEARGIVLIRPPDKNIRYYFLSILSVYILFENNYTGLWYFFAGPLFITKVSPRSVRQYYFCASTFAPCSGWIRAQVAARAA